MRIRTGTTPTGQGHETAFKMIVAELLGEKASPHTVSLIGFVVEQGRARDLPAIIDQLVRLAAAERQRAVAEVRTAVPLNDEQRAKLRGLELEHVFFGGLTAQAFPGGRSPDVFLSEPERRRLGLVALACSAKASPREPGATAISRRRPVRTATTFSGPASAPLR